MNSRIKKGAKSIYDTIRLLENDEFEYSKSVNLDILVKRKQDVLIPIVLKLLPNSYVRRIGIPNSPSCHIIVWNNYEYSFEIGPNIYPMYAWDLQKQDYITLSERAVGIITKRTLDFDYDSL